MNAQTPFDMDRAVAVARETMEELSTLLEVENQALRQRRLDAVRDELERKERLTRNLEVVLSGHARRSATGSASPSMPPVARA